MNTKATTIRSVLAAALIAAISAAASAQSIGDCDWGEASAVLDVNNVSARLFNNGGLFWDGRGRPYYKVPKSVDANVLFFQSLWIGGVIDGELHMAASDWGPREFWPGPIDEDGNPPADCSQYDRMYTIRRADIEVYEQTGELTDDLRDWPAELGAPVIDGDGNPDNYDLGAGDRPEMIGDQMVWWIMNDLGNEHAWSTSRVKPLSLEIHVTAYAFTRPTRLTNTTFYRYELVNRGHRPIEEMYFGLWVDGLLDPPSAPYVGCDTTLGLGFGYHSEDSHGIFGEEVPALGFDFLRGPAADSDGFDNDYDGEADETGERQAMTTFLAYSGDATVTGNVDDGTEAYNYLRGFWRDGRPITVGGGGIGFSSIPTRFMYPAEPGTFWSQENIDGAGSRASPHNRRFVMTTGPFRIEPGRSDEITYAIVFALADDRFAAVRELKKDAVYVQNAFDVGFQSATPPDPPVVTATELDGTVILKWENEPGSNNYLDSYDVSDPLLAKSDVEDKTYSLEGYNVFRFESAIDSVGERVATFDRANGVLRVLDAVSFDDQTGVSIIDLVAHGTDSGIRHAMRFDDLTNYRTYYFGIQAYAYSEHSDPHVLKSAIARISGQPSNPIARRGGTQLADSTYGVTLTLENEGVTKQGLGSGEVTAEIVDPTAVTGHTYRVEFAAPLSDPSQVSSERSTYTVLDETTGEVKLDGSLVEGSLGRPPTQAENVLLVDGLSISITGPEFGPLDIDGQQSWAFVQVQGGDGITPDACDTGAASQFGCREVGGNGVYASFNGAVDWLMYHNGSGPEETIGAFAPNDFEIRATDEGSYGYLNFSSGNVIWVPLEAWDIGPTGIFGVNDPSDDLQLIPALFSDNGGDCYFGFGEIEQDPFGLGWPVTDRLYAFYPASGSTYSDWASAVKPLVEGHPVECPTSPETDIAARLIDTSARPLQHLIWMMDPTSPHYRDEFIPVGNIIRFLTTKPNLPGDKFWIHTAGFEPKTNDLQTAKEALGLIGIVPNPYMGVSDYELTTIRDVVRFTNLPDVATIRIYNLAGTLITQLEKTPATTGLEWDLTNDKGHHISSGMYLVHVDVPGVGERVIKFGLVKKRR